MPRFAFTFSFYQRVSLNKMDASRSSSSSSQHYSVLLQTVSELRTDLEKTMIKIKNLEEQNQSLTTNYQVVKDELIQTRFKYNDTKESYLNAVAEKFEAERQHEAFMERLKLQLAEKTSEFDQIRDKLIPHDIDQLRIKVQEEHELKHKAQLQAVEHKFEQERSEHFATKRGYEKNKVEYETLIQHQQQEIQALRSNHEEVENELRERIVKLREQELAPVRDEKQRANRSQLSELGHIVELLREESKALKAERDEAIFAVEQAKSSHEETVAHLKSRLAVAEAARAAAEEQRSNLTVEGERKDAIIRSSRQSVEDLSARLEQALKQLAEAERVQSMLRDDHHKHTEALQTAMESERGDYQERTDSLTERLIEKEEALRRALREGAEAATRSETALADMRRTQQLEMQEARRKYVAVSTCKLQSINFIHCSNIGSNPNRPAICTDNRLRWRSLT
jgi:chromosome segregation ATPase